LRLFVTGNLFATVLGAKAGGMEDNNRFRFASRGKKAASRYSQVIQEAAYIGYQMRLMTVSQTDNACLSTPISRGQVLKSVIERRIAML
jgi:hypothetical protein